MDLPVAKFLKDESFDDLEILDPDDEVLKYRSPKSLKSGINSEVEKCGSGISLITSTLCTISEEQGWVVVIPAKALATTAAAALTGSMVAGVPGLAVGLITGAVIAYHLSPSRSSNGREQKSEVSSNGTGKTTLRQVFEQMTLQQKKDLIKELMSCLKQSSVRLVLVEILKNEEIRNVALTVLSNFLLKRLGLNFVRRK